jgi:hypothetical protein
LVPSAVAGALAIVVDRLLDQPLLDLQPEAFVQLPNPGQPVTDAANCST